MADDPPHRPLGFADVAGYLSALDRGDDVVLVGGQALGFWVDQLASRDPAVAAFVPATTTDLDLLGDRAAADHAARSLRVDVRVPHAEDRSPNSAVLMVDRPGGPMRIDFLERIVGLDADGIRERAVPVEREDGFKLRVLHPVDLLVSRIENVHALPQKRDEHSLRQANAAIAVARAATAVLAEEHPDQAARMSERLFAIARSPGAEFLRRRFGIDAFEAVRPHENLPAAFREQRYPEMVAAIADDRREAGDAQRPVFLQPRLITYAHTLTREQNRLRGMDDEQLVAVAHATQRRVDEATRRSPDPSAPSAAVEGYANGLAAVRAELEHRRLPDPTLGLTPDGGSDLSPAATGAPPPDLSLLALPIDASPQQRAALRDRLEGLEARELDRLIEAAYEPRAGASPDDRARNAGLLVALEVRRARDRAPDQPRDAPSPQATRPTSSAPSPTATAPSPSPPSPEATKPNQATNPAPPTKPNPSASLSSGSQSETRGPTKPNPTTGPKTPRPRPRDRGGPER